MPFWKKPENPSNHTENTLQKIDNQIHQDDNPDETRKQVIERIEKLEELKSKSQTTEKKAGDELMFHPELKTRIAQTQEEIQAQIDRLRASLDEFDEADKEVEKQTNLKSESFDFDNDPELQDEIKLVEKLREAEELGKKIGQLLEAGKKKEAFELLSDINNWTNVNEYFQNKYLQDAILNDNKEEKKVWNILVIDHDNQTYFVLIPAEYKTEVESTFFSAIKEKSKLKHPEFIDIKTLESITAQEEVAKMFHKLLEEGEFDSWGKKDIIEKMKRSSDFTATKKNKKIQVNIRMQKTSYHRTGGRTLVDEKGVKKFVKNENFLNRLKLAMKNSFYLPIEIEIEYENY